MLAAVHRGALAGVAAFSGTLDQVQALPRRAALRALCVTDPILLRESTPLAVAGVLQTLPALASLTIAFVLEHGYDNGGMLRTLVAACPHLQHLDLTCARKPSFTIVSPSLPPVPPRLTRATTTARTRSRARSAHYAS